MNNKGFTLIEVMLVLALIGVVSLIVIPKLDADFGYLDSYSKDLLYDIRFVREETMRGKNGYKIKLEADSYKVLIDDIEQHERDLKDKYEIIYTGDNISFIADGILKEGAQTITIRKKDLSEQVQIVVNMLGNSYIE